MRGTSPKWVAKDGVVADKRSPRESPICLIGDRAGSGRMPTATGPPEHKVFLTR